MRDESLAFWGSVGLIGLSAALYFGFVGNRLVVPHAGVANVVIGALAGLSFASLLCTRLRDPGFLPRGPHPLVTVAAPGEGVTEESGIGGGAGQPSSQQQQQAVQREVEVSGAVVRVTYCTTCNIFRPPRASHCRECGRCVAGFDHHCAWVGNCVGVRNYRHFVTLLLCVCCCCCAVCAVCAENVVLLALRNYDAGIESYVQTALLACPFALLLGAFCLCALVVVGGLLGLHLWLVSSALTTHEHLRGPLLLANPYDRGCLLNWLRLFCLPLPPSFPPKRHWHWKWHWQRQRQRPSRDHLV